MNAIELRGLRCGYGGRPVLHGVSVEIPRGEFLGILGPNGSGKTTLLRAVTRVIDVPRGQVTIGGTDVTTLTRREVARQVACVMQEHASLAESGHLAFTVRDLVTMGRTPYLERTGWERTADHEAVHRAMEQAEVADLADRPVTELSGGERQRVFIAMALAQDCEVILLDEPTNHLDVAHQIAILDLFAALNRDEGKTLVGVFHDLNLAAEYCERILMLKDGLVAGLGAPDDVLDGECVRTIYGASVTVQRSPVSGRPHVFVKRSE